jgi:predicted amidohydrolase
MSSNIIRIGVCQLNSRDDKNENFQIGEELINKAKKEQAKVSFKKIDFILIIIIK